MQLNGINTVVLEIRLQSKGYSSPSRPNNYQSWLHIFISFTIFSKKKNKNKILHMFGTVGLKKHLFTFYYYYYFLVFFQGCCRENYALLDRTSLQPCSFTASCKGANIPSLFFIVIVNINLFNYFEEN